MIFMLIAAILIILCLAGICADIAIVYTVFRFKRLRTAFNIFLANWAIADLFALILLPVRYGFDTIGHSLEVDCLFMEGVFTLHVTEILFGTVLSIDWCFAAYFQRQSEKFRKHFRYVIASVWLLALLFYIIGSSLCLSRTNYSIITILFVICYSVNLIIVIALQCSRIVQRCRTLPISYPKPLTLRLTLITVITLSYLLAVISAIIMYFGVFYRNYFHYLILSAAISAAAIFGSSVVTLILLCCLNYDFRKCLFQLRKPAHERFDNTVSETEDTVKSPPEISFNTSIQNVLTNENQDSVS